MSLRNLIRSSHLLVEQSLQEFGRALKANDVSALRALDVSQLQQRILMSASPLAAVVTGLGIILSTTRHSTSRRSRRIHMETRRQTK